MLDNHTYNLVKQLVQESKSLWRITNKYKEEAHDCDNCKAFWEDMEKDKEKHVAKLRELVKNHPDL